MQRIDFESDGSVTYKLDRCNTSTLALPACDVHP